MAWRASAARASHAALNPLHSMIAASGKMLHPARRRTVACRSEAIAVTAIRLDAGRTSFAMNRASLGRLAVFQKPTAGVITNIP
jgi:hypothetical protein